MNIYASCVDSAHEGQKRALDPLDCMLQRVVSHNGDWEMKVGPTQEQLVYLAAEPFFK